MEIKMCDEFYYRVADEKKNIFQEFNTSKANVLRNNPSINLYCGEWVKIKKNNFTVHCVKPAETLLNIAKEYGTEKEKIIKDNNLINDRLFIGQILKIYQ